MNFLKIRERRDENIVRHKRHQCRKRYNVCPKTQVSTEGVELLSYRPSTVRILVMSEVLYLSQFRKTHLRIITSLRSHSIHRSFSTPLFLNVIITVTFFLRVRLFFIIIIFFEVRTMKQRILMFLQKF